MSKVKFQHYVPRFYLKEFCFDIRKGSGYLYCYDKINSTVRTSNINRVAGQNYFFDDSGCQIQSIEKSLSSIEAKFKPTFKKLCKFEDLTLLSYDERIMISLYVVTQEIRTFETRENLRSRILTFKKHLKDKGIEMVPKLKDEIEEALTKENLRDSHRSLLDEIPNFANIIFQMKWMLIRNPFDVPLWTSDQPVVKWNDEDHGIFGNLGYLSSGIQIFFPLNPKLCISFIDPIKYTSLPSVVTAPSKENITHQKWLQLVSSTRYIFSNINDFSLAEEYLMKHPELRNPDRPRSKIT